MKRRSKGVRFVSVTTPETASLNAPLISRRSFIKGTAGMIALTAASGIWRPGRVMASPDMAVGVIAPSHCASPYIISDLSGRFREAGLNVQVNIYTDMKLAARDLLEGKLQAAQLTLPLYLALKAGKGPVDSPKPVVATQFTGTEGGAIVLRKGSSAKKLEDLEGLKIASHTRLTVHYLILATLMERKNFSRESIENIAVLPLQKIVPALKTGEIDAFIAPEPVNSLAQAKGAGEVFVGTKMLWTEHPCCLAASTEKFAGDNRELLQAFTNVMVNTGLEMQDSQSRKGLMAILKGSEPYGKLPPAALVSAFSPEQSGFNPYPFLSSFMAAKTMMEDRGLLGKADLNVNTLGVDMGFVNAAYAKLGMTVPEPVRREKVAGKVLA